MGVRIASASSTTIVTASVPITTESIIAQTGALGLIQDNAQVLLHWYALIFPGASAANVIVRIRRGTTITSTLVNIANNLAIVPSVVALIAGTYVDSPGVATGVQYAMSITVSGGAANTTVVDTCLTALVL